MKNRKFTKFLAVVLALTFFFSAIGVTTVGASSAEDVISDTVSSGDPGTIILKVLKDMLDSIIRVILNSFSGLFPDNPRYIPEDEVAVPDEYYAGSTDFKSSADADAKWNLGYSNISLVPDDVTNGTYFVGGYIAIENGFTNVVEGVIDDMKARCVAINDGTGSGTVLFATIDCIGITNNDICDIRALVKAALPSADLEAINIASAHCHSGIDTEGLWTNNIIKLISNGVSSATNPDAELQQGTNPMYMAFMKQKVADALVAAYENLTPGKLTYAIKDIGSDYFDNKNRPSATALMTDLSRFVFTPDDTSMKPTMMLNMAAHPDVAGLPTSENSGREVSGDYVYYVGEFLEKYNYNFMFFQGAIAGIYMARGASNDSINMEHRWEQSQRYGYEIARMALAMTMTEAEIKADSKNDYLLSNKAEIDAHSTETNYTIWYTGWTKVEEKDVEPFLNIALSRVEVPVSSDLISAVGKLNMANYGVIAKKDGTYAIMVEIGYMELGNQFKTVFLPGEVCQDLIVGGESLKAESSHTGTAFGSKTAVEIFGSDVKCFGLMNDAIGYIVPDNDFTMGDPANHYHELISVGQYVASSCMDGLEALFNSINSSTTI